MTILEMREKRAKAWEAAKAFLDSHRTDKGVLSAEDDATYSRMEQEISDLGKEISRMERLEALDAQMKEPVNHPLTGKPMRSRIIERTGRASDEYRTSFWDMMRSKAPLPSVVNALQEETDSEGGYLVPDEYERTLVEALEEENVLRQLAKVIRTSSGDRKIPVVASKGTASWIDEEGAYTERHTHATMLIEAGANVKNVQTRLGHNNIQTTLQTYVHDTEKMGEQSVELFEQLTIKKA